MKITSLQIENVKRVKALRLEPSPQGLTVIGGKNRQGKTSVLDAICAALGGQKKVPSNITRDGAMNPASIRVELSNGLVVERKGKNATLTVTDPTGIRHGQKLLDSFVNQFALDLPAFMAASSKDKAHALLETLGIAVQLDELERKEKALYDERTATGRIADAKEKHAQELPEYPDAPEEPVSVSDLIQAQQAILQRNAVRQAHRDQMDRLLNQKQLWTERVTKAKEELANAERMLSECNDALADAEATEQTPLESTAELERAIASHESINTQVAANTAKTMALDEAQQHRRQYDDLTIEIDKLRLERLSLLEGCALPLPELTVVDGELVYRGQRWDCMSGSEQIRVGIAVAAAMNPECRFVLVDKLEQLDAVTMRELDAWLKEHDLQVIATRVSTDPDECTIVIEDGLPVGSSYIEETTGIKDDAFEGF